MGRAGRVAGSDRPAHADSVGPGSCAGLGAEDEPAARAARSHADGRIRGGDRRRDCRGGLRVARCAGCACGGRGSARAVCADARRTDLFGPPAPASRPGAFASFLKFSIACGVRAWYFAAVHP